MDTAGTFTGAVYCRDHINVSGAGVDPALCLYLAGCCFFRAYSLALSLYMAPIMAHVHAYREIRTSEKNTNPVIYGLVRFAWFIFRHTIRSCMDADGQAEF